MQRKTCICISGQPESSASNWNITSRSYILCILSVNCTLSDTMPATLAAPDSPSMEAKKILPQGVGCSAVEKAEKAEVDKKEDERQRKALRLSAGVPPPPRTRTLSPEHAQGEAVCRRAAPHSAFQLRPMHSL